MAKTSANANLHQARNAKKDEFYTQFSDIENELKHYREHFKNKVVYCNCDDPLASNFFKYFFLNFKYLKLKELITTCYKSQNFREFSAVDKSSKNALMYSMENGNLGIVNLITRASLNNR